MRNAVMELMEIKRALRAERFVKLQEQINTSVGNRATQRGLATESQAGKTSSKLVVASASNVANELVITFKPDEAEVRIKSSSWDYTIRVCNVEPASTGLQRRQGYARSWSVLEDAGVERMLDSAFSATFPIQ